MRFSRPCRINYSHLRRHPDTSTTARSPLIHIQDGTFYRRHPSSVANPTEDESNKPLFPGLNFSLKADQGSDQHFAIIGPSNAGKTTFLEILQGRHLCFPPSARTYPYLSSDEIMAKDRRLSRPGRSIQYVGFNEKQKGLSGMGSYLSARFESRKEQTDFKLIDYLRGRTQLNTSEEYTEKVDEAILSKVIEDLRLEKLLDMPVSNLSNGQTRRARIAKALMGNPELLLLDEPFMGLDPPTTVEFNPLLRRLAYSGSPRILLALRPQDPIPNWITDVLYLGEELKITARGTADDVTMSIDAKIDDAVNDALHYPDPEFGGLVLREVPQHHIEFGRLLFDEGVANNPIRMSKRNRFLFREAIGKYKTGDRSPDTLRCIVFDDRSDFPEQDYKTAARKEIPKAPPLGETLLEMNGVTIEYGGKSALGDWHEQLKMQATSSGEKVLIRGEDDTTTGSGLHWQVRRGQRWAVIGPNGSGKTSLLSLITSDHPQAYSAPMTLFGRTRLPQPGKPGMSLFEIQSRIGQSSPEVHSFFPKNLSVRRTLESAWADTPLGKPKLDIERDLRVDACLRWFQGELNPAIGPHPLLQDELSGHVLSRGPGFAKSDLAEHVMPYGQMSNAEKTRQARRYGFAEKQREAVEWADEMRFREMTFSGQRVALFLRAIIAQPDIVILDEAFSGMDEILREKCLLFLEFGESRMQTPYSYSGVTTRRLSERRRRTGRLRVESITIPEGLTANQALIVVSHVPQEIPRSVADWIYLPASGTGAPAITGHADKVQLRSDTSTWAAIWRASSLAVMSGAELEEERAAAKVSAAPGATDDDSADAMAGLDARLHSVRTAVYRATRVVRRIKLRRSGERASTSQSRRRAQLEYEETKRPARELAQHRRLLVTLRDDPAVLAAEITRRLNHMANWCSILKGETWATLYALGDDRFRRPHRGPPTELSSVADADTAVEYLRVRHSRYHRQAFAVLSALYGRDAVAQRLAPRLVLTPPRAPDMASLVRRTNRLRKRVVATAVQSVDAWAKICGVAVDSARLRTLEAVLEFLRARPKEERTGQDVREKRDA